MPVSVSVPSQSASVVVAALLEHPNVIAASMISEEAVDGQLYGVAYVVPDSAQSRDAEAKAYGRDQEDRLSKWRMSFDLAYRSSTRAAAPDFAGWKSSYTNKPLPREEMQEWLAFTTQRILSFRPADVFEIGCGVGLLVQTVAPGCGSYTGSDISPVAIACLRDFVASKPELSHVGLYEGEAVELSSQPACSVDTVVVNSVVQYFPNLDYLRKVIKSAIRIVRPGGRIFIGDIRHFGLLPLFHTGVQLARAPSNASIAWLKRRITRAVEGERELAVDPEFFHQLLGSEPGISNVETLLKKGKARNELTGYRYDAILHVGGERQVGAQPYEELEGDAETVASTISRAKAGRLQPTILKNIPNRRLACDIAVLRTICSANEQADLDSIARQCVPERSYDRDPQEFWAIADETDCDISLSWSPRSAEGCFDVTIASRQQIRPRPARSERATQNFSGPLSTNPLEAAFRQQLAMDLHRALREKVSGSDVPAMVVPVDTLPAGPGLVTGRSGRK